jgi:uroporphyrinogen decarboxylase
LKYRPDFSVLKKALTRDGIPERVPCWELFVDIEIMQDILGQKIIKPYDNESADRYVDQVLEFQLGMGYDFLPILIEPPLPRTNILSGIDTAELAKDQRNWVDEHNGMINNWEDFEKYPWQGPSSINYLLLERAAKKVPDGMKICAWSTGILENVQWLMGYEPMSYATVEEPELIEALFGKIGELMGNFYETASQIPEVGMLAMGDDMGFKTGTLFSPSFFRKYVFPLQKKCVDAAHKYGHPFVLHSCGQLQEIMDDLIDYVGIDAKHSFEDVILSVEDAKRLYGSRVAIAGGIDMDFLSRSNEEEVRQRVRRTLEECAPGGGYIMGSGNSIANYIPVKNYKAMMEETRNFIYC